MTTESEYQILICLVEIWSLADKTKLTEVSPSPFMMTDVSEINISESFRNVSSTATVEFPRGSVVRKTITKVNEADAVINASFTDLGVLGELRGVEAKLMSDDSFRIEDRIRIYLGYTTDPYIANLPKIHNASHKTIYNDSALLAEYKKHLTMMFDGFISNIEMEQSIVLYCSDLLYNLNKITSPKITADKLAVNDYLGPNGQYQLLKGAGLKLHPASEKSNIELGKVSIPEGMTVSEVLQVWSKENIVAFLSYDNGVPCVSVARSYFSDNHVDSVMYYGEKKSEVVEIKFNYHVAENKLKSMANDKRYLAIDATAFTPDGSTMKVLLCMDDDIAERKYRVLEKSTTSKKEIKFLGTRAKEATLPKNMYRIIPYLSKAQCQTYDDLIDLTIKYYEAADINGFKGDLVIFGDLALKSACKVKLIDNRSPAKNGIYVVEDVHTVFGSRGYRQGLKIKHCLRRDGVAYTEPDANAVIYTEAIQWSTLQTQIAKFAPSQLILDFIIAREGCDYKASDKGDGAGYTIGHGHTGINPLTNKEIQPGDEVTAEEAMEIFKIDVKNKTADINQKLAQSGIVEANTNMGGSTDKPYTISQNEYDAIFSMLYNSGVNSCKIFWRKYTDMVKRTGRNPRNETDMLNAGTEMLDNCFDVKGGKAMFVPGLRARRMAEYKIFMYDDYEDTKDLPTIGESRFPFDSLWESGEYKMYLRAKAGEIKWTESLKTAEFIRPNPSQVRELQYILDTVLNTIWDRWQQTEHGKKYYLSANSGYRDIARAKVIGRRNDSAHHYGAAIDVQPLIKRGAGPSTAKNQGEAAFKLLEMVIAYLKEINMEYDQLLFEKGAGFWVHVSLRHPDHPKRRNQIATLLKDNSEFELIKGDWRAGVMTFIDGQTRPRK